jgi:hypothetical protein
MDIKKKQKLKVKLLSKKIDIIIKDDEKRVFINQVYRKDILMNMMANTNLTGEELLNIIFNSENRPVVVKKTIKRIIPKVSMSLDI